MTKTKIILVLIAMLAMALFFGCASKSIDLLAEDHTKMKNEQLLEYYYRLNDEIEKQEKQTGPSVSVGLGTFGRGVGGGVGVGTGGAAYTADDLRARRIEVRMELQRRNITP